MMLSVFRWLHVIHPERLSDALSHVLMRVNASAMHLCTSAAMSVSVVLLR